MSESTHNIPLLEGSSETSNQPLPLASASPFSTPSQLDDEAKQIKPKSQVQEAAMDIGFGSVAGMVGKVIEYPFDTVKVRLQSSAQYAGPLDCFARSVRAEGVAGLYRGISAPMFGAAVETSSLFLSYRVAQEVVERVFYGKAADGVSARGGEPLPLSALVVCGAASGAFTSTLLTPIELVKCQMQVPLDAYGMHAAPGPGGQAAATAGAAVQRYPLSVIASVYRHNGLAGFWRGQLGTLIRETGGSGAWFGGYESVKALFKKRRQQQRQRQGLSSDARATNEPLPVWQQMTAGACAGMAYNLAFYPADTIKSRMQTEAVGAAAGGHAAPKPNFMDVGRALWKEQGLRGMYRGCGITVGRAAPSSAFIFSVYETLRAWFG